MKLKNKINKLLYFLNKNYMFDMALCLKPSVIVGKHQTFRGQKQAGTKNKTKQHGISLPESM